MHAVNSVTILSMALTFFLVINPIGNSPAILSIVKDYEFNRQKIILFREGVFSMLLAIFFLFMGERFLSALQISDYTLTMCGGILLFLVSLKMIFSAGGKTDASKPKQEPFIVPIATPLLSGPGLLTIIMLYAHQVENNLKVLTAVILAGIGVITILSLAPYIQKLFGKRGMAALEQLMGMILAMMAMSMIVRGAALYLTSLKAALA